MKFIANDGTVFDHARACEIYEDHGMTIHDAVNILRTFVHIYDRAQRVINFALYLDQSGLDLSDMDWLNNFISRIECDDCYYFRIDCDEKTWETVYDILEEEGSAEIPKHPGLYWWDDEWISYEDDKRNFDNRWKGVAY